MPKRTRQDMHIGIDLGINLLNANLYGKLVPEVKDYFINKTIDKFIDECIHKDVNLSNPNIGLSYEMIIQNYNKIHTLITEAPLTLDTQVAGQNYLSASLPVDLHHFETSYSIITDPVNSSQNLQVPNNTPLLTDIVQYNQHPYGGGQRYPSTAIFGNKIRIYHYNRLTVTSAFIIYIKTPAKLVGGTTPVDCDLPAAYHDQIIDRTVSTIVALGNLPNYQQVLMDLENKK